MESQAPTVLCKDCKHSFRNWSDILFYTGKYSYKCRKNFTAAAVEPNFVTGSEKVNGKYETCSYSRLNSQPCKEIGELWEPKDPKKHFFTIIKHEASLGKK